MAAVAVAQSANKTRFDLADVLLFDAVPQNRSTTRTALGMVGFRQLFATSDYNELLTAWRGKAFDLFVADITQDTARLCELVRAIRGGHMGGNPFVHVVLMAWKLDDDLVKSALHCGADDLVTRPYSVGFLSGRFKSITEARKGFVVTGDYIGPDRRRDPGRGCGNIPMFEVPNTLKLKSGGDCELARLDLELPNAIREARTKINAERAKCGAFQISILAQFAREAAAAKQPLERDLDRLEATMKDLGRRLEGGNDGALKICESLDVAIAGAKGGENVADHFGKIQELAVSLYLAVNPGRSANDLKAEVDKEVASIKSRGRRD